MKSEFTFGLDQKCVRLKFTDSYLFLSVHWPDVYVPFIEFKNNQLSSQLKQISIDCRYVYGAINIHQNEL